MTARAPVIGYSDASAASADLLNPALAADDAVARLNKDLGGKFQG